MSSENWSKKKFSELCDITRGASPRPIHNYISKLGVPWIKIADATASESRFITETKECIKPEGVKSSVKVGPGDLILSNSATPGLPKFVQIKACIHDGWMLLRNFKNLDKKYAYWLLLSERKNLVSQGTGTVFTNLKTDILKNHEVLIPPLLKQQRIVKYLDDIADKIELNHQINQTLEQIAQAIFKSWFVDFEPVKAKIAAKENGHDPERAAIRAISGKSNAELNQLTTDQLSQLATTAALFPDELVDSELVVIPKGWQIFPLGDHLEVLETGRRPKGGVSGITEGVPSVGAENILRIGQYNFGKEKFVDRIFFDKLARGVVESEDVLLYKDGGKPGEFKPRVSMFGHDFPYKEFAINEHVFRLRSKRLGQPFLYLLISHENVLFELRHKGGKAAIPGINQNDVRSVKILAPPAKLLEKFNTLIHPTVVNILHNAKQNVTLSNLRDTLLPKLLSGEISVAETQTKIEAAL